MKKIKSTLILLFVFSNAWSQTKIYSKNYYDFFSLDKYKIKNGNCKLYFINDKNDTSLYDEGEIYNRKKQGLWTYFDVFSGDSAYNESFYINGKREGIERAYNHSKKLLCLTTFQNDIHISGILFNENGIVDYESDNNRIRLFYPNGQLKEEQIFKHDSSGLIYNYCECALSRFENFSFQEKMIGGDGLNVRETYNDSYVPFNGNEWYENGTKKVSCKLVNINPYTIEVTHFDSLGRTIIFGKRQHVEIFDKDLSYECFERIGTWIYYNTKSEIEKSVEYKLTTKPLPNIFGE